MKWIFLYFFGQFLGLDGTYLALLGPLLASLASGLTPSTRGNPVSTRSRPIFDPFFFRDLDKIVFGLSTPLICLGWPRNHHKKIRLEILHIWASAACQTELVVQFYGHVNPFHPTVAVKTVHHALLISLCLL